jgi:RNA polymerase sigma-70 factor, ECF subfamily
MDDRIAISRLKQGDLNGLETLVNRYQAQAVHAAYLIVYDRAIAEDVVHTAFVKAAERIHQFDEERPFAPWFFRIVTNDALKAAKKQKRTTSLEEQLDEPTARFAQWLVDPSWHPEKLVEETEMRQVILEAIQRLPPEQRRVVIMRYYLDMSETDMSTTMNRPLSTIKWWLRDARKRLYDLMRPQSGS